MRAQAESPINFLTLHRDAVRHRYYVENQDRDPFYDSTCGAWIIGNPAHCKQIIASSDVRPGTSDCAADYLTLSERLGIDFSPLLFAFGHIPLCLHAEAHQRSRRQLSEFLAERKAELTARIPSIIAQRFEVMRHEGRVELMSEAVVPMALDVLSIISDFGVSAAQCENVSVAFDKLIGMSKRRRVSADLSKLTDLIAARLGPEASDTDVGSRLALLVLGRDPLVGTFGESLHHIFKANSGSCLSDIDYPDLPPQTGVPVVERIVTRPFRIGECQFAEGDRLRVHLQSFAYAADARIRSNFFGGGAHTCLGRPLSMDLWRAMTTLLSNSPLRITLLSSSRRESDYVFTCPQSITVELGR
jgi:cytochrome P450